MGNSSTSTSPPTDDPLVVYARSLHSYTLRLWAETRRLAEEDDRARQIEKSPPISAEVEEEVKDETKDMSSSQPDHSPSDDQT